MVSAVPNPQTRATAAMESSDSSSTRRADFEADLLDVASGSHPHFVGEPPCERPLAHLCPRRQRRDRQIALGVVGDPSLHLAHVVALARAAPASWALNCA